MCTRTLPSLEALMCVMQSLTHFTQLARFCCYKNIAPPFESLTCDKPLSHFPQPANTKPLQSEAVLCELGLWDEVSTYLNTEIDIYI